MNFYIAQALGIIITIINIIAPHFKKKSTILFISTTANVLYLGVYYLLGEDSGVAMYIVMIARSLTFYLFSRKEKKAPFWVMLLFVSASIISVIVTWSGWVCLLLLGAAANTYGQWQKNLKVLRVALIITTLSLGTYNVLVGAYTGAVNEYLQVISASVALWRFRKAKIAANHAPKDEELLGS